MQIAMISEHAPPLAAIGGVDAGGQNIYVAHVARGLAQAGHDVDVFTRKDNVEIPTVVTWAPRLRVIHVHAGVRALLQNLVAKRAALRRDSRQLFHVRLGGAALERVVQLAARDHVSCARFGAQAISERGRCFS